MRTFITVLCITVCLLGLVIGEKVVLNNFYSDFSNGTDTLNKALNKKTNIDESVKNLSDIWDSHKKKVFAFANHNGFKEIESSISNIKYETKEKNYKKALYYVNNVSDKITEIKDNMNFSLENIL